MLIKTNQILLDYSGQPLKMNDKELDLNTVFMAALNYVEDAKFSTIEEKIRIYDVSKRMIGTTEIDLTIEDLALIKKNVNKIFSPVVVGQLVEIIEQK